MISCKCGAPESVDLSAWFAASTDRATVTWSRDGSGESPLYSHQERDDAAVGRIPGEASVESVQVDEMANRLYGNLPRFGWSPISISAATLAKASLTLKDAGGASSWRIQVMELFRDGLIQGLLSDTDGATKGNEKSTARSFLGGCLTFRTSESGSPDIVEPKSSWEYKDPSSLVGTSSSSSQFSDKGLELVQRRLESWGRLCKEVAHAVRRILDLPPVLLSPLTQPSGLAGTRTQARRPSVDLLRAFCYDVVATGCESQQQGALMGSSPHTDWGSFTVVWQDSVGGLQTYCRACQEWAHVPSTPIAPSNAATRQDESTNGRIDFVVHVGDMTSLAIRHAQLLSSSASSSSTSTPTGKASIVMPFPSPLHRVLSPTAEKRVSLVYFAYPSPDATLDDLVQALLKWRLLPPTLVGDDAKLPYDEYYLLRNQNCADGETNFATQYNKLVHVPVRVALEEKWNQVQRAP